MLHRLCLSRRQRSCLTVPVLKPGRPAAHQAAVGETQEGQVDRVVLVGAAQAADVSWLFNLLGVSLQNSAWIQMAKHGQKTIANGISCGDQPLTEITDIVSSASLS